jgi:hypothetical protein
MIISLSTNGINYPRKNNNTPNLFAWFYVSDGSNLQIKLDILLCSSQPHQPPTEIGLGYPFGKIYQKFLGLEFPH